MIFRKKPINGMRVIAEGTPRGSCVHGVMLAVHCGWCSALATPRMSPTTTTSNSAPTITWRENLEGKGA
jgi:hypothetical protein